MPLTRLAIVVADRASKLGQAIVTSGVIVTDRSSVVLPVTVPAVPALAQAAGLPEAERFGVTPSDLLNVPGLRPGSVPLDEQEAEPPP